MNLPEFTESDSLWVSLSHEKRPIIIYGTGNGADKIIDALASFGIRPTAVFASSGFVRSRTFRGFEVRSYEDIISEYGDDIVILLAFGSALPEIAERCRELEKKHTLLIPEVPLYPSELFTYGYYTEHKAELESVMALLSDDESRAIFSDMLSFRMTGRPEYLLRTSSFGDSVKELFSLKEIKTAVDAGAFIGDTALSFADNLPDLRKIIALEPDPRTFRKLSAYAESESRCEIVPLNFAAYDEEKEVSFESSGGRGAASAGTSKRAKTTAARCTRIDSVCADDDIDLIKYDVEGDEEKAIAGSSDTIARCRPSLIVSLYHRTEDLVKLPLTVHSMLPDAKLYLRRVPCIPAWDLELFAVSDRAE